MLIPSDKHKPEDLRVWRDYADGDLAYALANARRLARLEASAVQAVQDYAAAGPCYVATSWGKDATVVAAIAAIACPRLPLVFIDQREADPTGEADLVAGAFFLRHPRHSYHVIVGDSGGRATVAGKRTAGLLAGIKEAGRRFGTRWIGGLRRGEKGGRQFRTSAITESSCAPIFDWTTEDVFAYLAFRDLPVHPRYAMTSGGKWPRDRIRVCTFGGVRGNAGGREQWEREYYRDVLNRLAAGRAASPSRQS